jgi:toxin ParE1/3/4
LRNLKDSVAYLVNVSSRAERDLASVYDRIHAEHSETALRWYAGLKKTVLSLEDKPLGCPVVRKRDKARQLLYGSKPHVYSVFYRVLRKQKRVDVVHIRHAGRRKPKGDDLV